MVKEREREREKRNKMSFLHLHTLSYFSRIIYVQFVSCDIIVYRNMTYEVRMTYAYEFVYEVYDMPL